MTKAVKVFARGLTQGKMGCREELNALSYRQQDLSIAWTLQGGTMTLIILA